MRTLFTAALFASVNALYEGLIKINDDNYEDLVLNDKNNFWVLTFYADWCQYATALEHEIYVNSRNMATKGYNVKYGAVNVSDSPQMVHRYRIQQSPTITLYGQDKKHPMTYGGVRTSQDLDAFVAGECIAEGYDRTQHIDGTVIKDNIDIQALEEEIVERHEQRLSDLDAQASQEFDSAINRQQIIADAITQASQKQIDEIIFYRDTQLKYSAEQHEHFVELLKDTYKNLNEQAEQEHSNVIEDLRRAYLTDYGIDNFLRDNEDVEYIQGLDLADFRFKMAVNEHHAANGFDYGWNDYYGYGYDGYGYDMFGEYGYGYPEYGYDEYYPYPEDYGYGYYDEYDGDWGYEDTGVPPAFNYGDEADWQGYDQWGTNSYDYDDADYGYGDDYYGDEYGYEDEDYGYGDEYGYEGEDYYGDEYGYEGEDFDYEGEELSPEDLELLMLEDEGSYDDWEYDGHYLEDEYDEDYDYGWDDEEYREDYPELYF